MRAKLEQHDAEQGARMGKYCPSNGTEGMDFYEWFCEDCERDREFRETDGNAPGCDILARTMIYDVDDDEYPSEWIYDADDRPTCTAFVQIGTRLPADVELEAAGQARFPL